MTAAAALQAARRFWWVLLSLGALGAILGALPEPATPAETSDTTYLSNFSILLSTDDLNGIQNLPLVNQLAVFATRGEVPKRVAASLGQGESDGPVLASQVQITVDTTASSVNISTTQPTADAAVKLVNAFGDELVAFIAEHQDNVRSTKLERLLTRQVELERQIKELQADLEAAPGDALVQAKLEAASRQYGINTELFDSISANSGTLSLVPLERGVAIPQTTVSSGLGAPKSRSTRGALGFLIGLSAGLGVALLLARLDRRIRTRPHAETIFGGPASITIPFVAGNHSGLQVTPDRHDLLSDAYRTMRSIITFSQAAHPRPEGAPRARVTLIISAGSGDGKTATAANLAAAMAETGRRVAVVNADFRRPTLMGRIVQPPPPPLPFFLDQLVDAPIKALLQRTPVNNLVVLDLTSVKASPGNLARATISVMPELMAVADAIVIDSSPIGLTAEVIDLLPMVDTVVMVMRLGNTLSHAAERTVELVRNLSNATFLLAVVADSSEQSSYGEYGDNEDRVQSLGKSLAKKLTGGRATNSRSSIDSEMADTSPLGIERPADTAATRRPPPSDAGPSIERPEPTAPGRVTRSGKK